MKIGFVRRQLPGSLAARLITLLLLALVISQGVSFVIFLDERRAAVRFGHQQQVLARTASIVRLLRDTPPALHPRIVSTASTPALRYRLSRDSALVDQGPARADHVLARRLAARLGGAAERVLVQVSFEDGRLFRFGRRRAGFQVHDHGHDDDDEERHHMGGRPLWLAISVLVADGTWLNATTALPPQAPWDWPALVSTGVMAVAISLIVVLVVRRITRPMQRLADAADRLGRGEQIPPILEDGPEEVRRTTRAFNRMRERVARFVQDRTRMLAAISHDLRTLITTLRLRAEFVEDRETRERMLETLEEMQRMTETTLAFAQDQAAREETRGMDLAALAGSLCDDLSDIGHDVIFAQAPKTPYACRPASLKRALRNLIENAATYGGRARVHLTDSAREIAIVIEDDGPGIAEGDHERIFEPFVRLEESRSRETGGVGLGMAIARSIIRGHGGDILLENRKDGGLRVSVILPRA